MSSNLKDIEEIRPSSSYSTEAAKSSIPTMGYPGQRLSEALSMVHADNPKAFQGASSKKTNNGTNTELNLSSLDIFGPGRVKPSHHGIPKAQEELKEHHLDDSSKSLEKILEVGLTAAAQGSAVSQVSVEANVGSIAREDTLMGGIIIEERTASRMTDIDV